MRDCSDCRTIFKDASRAVGVAPVLPPMLLTLSLDQIQAPTLITSYKSYSRLWPGPARAAAGRLSRSLKRAAAVTVEDSAELWKVVSDFVDGNP